MERRRARGAGIDYGLLWRVSYRPEEKPRPRHPHSEPTNPASRAER